MKCIDCVMSNNWGGIQINDAVVIHDGKSICKAHLLHDYYVQTPTVEGRKVMERIEAALQ